MGFKDESTGEFVDPEAVRHMATRMKQETEILRESRLKREEEGLKNRPPGKGDGPKSGGPQG